MLKMGGQHKPQKQKLESRPLGDGEGAASHMGHGVNSGDVQRRLQLKDRSLFLDLQVKKSQSSLSPMMNET